MNKVFIARQKDGILSIERRDDFASFLRSFGDNKLEIVARKINHSRSNYQNRYYWGVIIKTISDHIGWEEDDVHEYLKDKFLRIKKELVWEEVEFPCSTRHLNVKQMEEYLEKCRRWSAQTISLYIPLPNEIDI